MSQTESGVVDTIRYQLEPDLSPADFIDVLQRSGLAERRPVQDASRIRGMLEHADVLVTARTADGRLVGVSRAISDFSFCTYLSDLAVDRAYQRRGIGKELIRQTHLKAGESASLILLAAPQAREYYPHIGMQRHDSCWIISRALTGQDNAECSGEQSSPPAQLD
jgi:ribosomal protein S18 acetylase RimI-like enzyme